jgi:hypothetical protein
MEDSRFTTCGTCGMNYVKIIATLLFISSLFGAGIYYRNVVSDRDRYKIERNNAREAFTRCQSDQKITEGVSNDYQSKIRALNNQLGNLKRLRASATCIPVTHPSLSNNGTSAREELSGRNINSDYLIDFAGRAEETRLKLLGCQQFINQTWESRNGH